MKGKTKHRQGRSHGIRPQADLRALAHQAESALEHGHVDRACELLSQAHQSGADGSLAELCARAYSLQAYSRWEKSRRALPPLERAIEAAPARADLRRLHGHLLRRSGALKPAAAELKVAQRLAPGEPEIAFEALLSQLAAGERGLHLQEATASLQGSALSRISALLAAFDGDPISAERELARSSDPIDRVLHAILLLAQSETAKAVPPLDAAARDEELPLAVRAYASLYLGVAHTQLRQPKPAVDALDRARALGVPDHLVQAHLSWACQQLAIDAVLSGDLAAAAEWFGRLEKLGGPEAAAARDNAAEALSLKGQELARDEDYDAASEAWSQALAMRPRDFALRQNLAVALERAGRTEDAIPHWHELTRQLPRPAGGRAQPHRNGEASAEQEDALRLHIRAVAHRHLADLYLEQDEAGRAIEQLEQALRAVPSDVDTRRSLARLLMEEGKIKKAIPHFEQVVAAEPNSAEDHLDLGLAHLVMDAQEAGLRELDAALALRPDDPAIQSTLGLALVRRVLRSPKADTALDDARRALGLLPEKSMSIAYLALGAAQLAQGNRREAEKGFRQAVRGTPRKATAMAQVGRAYWKAGERDAAVKAWSGAMNKAKKDPESYIDLAVAWAQAGDTERFQECLREAMWRLGPEEAIDSVEMISRSRELQPFLRQVLKEMASSMDDPLDLVAIAEMLIYAADVPGARSLLNRATLDALGSDNSTAVTAALDLDLRYRLLDRKTAEAVLDWMDGAELSVVGAP